MVHYPPSYPNDQPTNSYYGNMAHVHSLHNFAKKKRFDISIGLQSALSIIYLSELVYYFVRLRHLAGTQPAAWRASLMTILLILDLAMIWLTVRSKRTAIKGSASSSPVANGETGTGFGVFGNQGPNPYATPMDRLDAQSGNYSAHHPELGPYNANAPRAPEPLNLNSTHPSLHINNEPRRSHLNTPITE
ncbi:hypothetical protein J3B02_002264 [Coemansia erecta]|uniref:Uncharacterized protein n=1 Tax=Coemansia asiatica TaxID=1052880 RepID=A0A9W7XMW3_9FUNG|nr:hypothetical protein LPJ64_002391 [Coemansia asiatica]KAJ2855257.1 hypothetical protein J3B02_002264 [Coemansia erecta]KAJ2884185.1 hypothetical protein FB639_002010 [Coemansia asiatica]